ncbi:D-alanyl-D-alanine carboxypeptidase [Gemmobacter lanyuensis]|uniref:serine-type D-Ala-D-Ala carboxypeptidase n=1 Tax=Gemmobacter lanyuensis TaxID=1054497 RepID=A0A918J3G5_9RHOB|nr:D-alanyl-D-alanine carboxypeptidase family protein [Gemmobacter lanyuensis]GGW45893.1 D-alanyl-D-alanine carboxypeptidase [Gemmobacter lanyuensis]
MFSRFSLALAFLLGSAPAWAFETQATAAWVYDLTTQTVLLDKNANTAIPPASMSKLMTLNMLFEALHDGRYQTSDTFAVSEKAWKMGGSKMFVKPDDRPTVDELIHGIIINSGNDACVVVAEGMAGSEEEFARRMTERAGQLGMDHSTFANASGWPDPDHRMSAHDLGLLAVRLITEFPEYYSYFALTEYNYQGRVPANGQNRNPLLRIKGGDWKADGLKTGHTEEAGYGLVGSAVQDNGRRIVFVIAGLPSDKARAEESERIASWAFREYAMKTIAKAGTRVAEAEVWMGDAETVGLVPAEDVARLIPVAARDQMTAEVAYTGPLKAPIAKGDQVAELVVQIPGLPEARVPLVAEADVPKGGFGKKLTTAAQVLIKRFFPAEAPAS